MPTNNKLSPTDFLQILGDFRWHQRQEFLPLARHIAPEIASRAYMQAVPTHDKEKRRSDAPEAQVRYGRHRIIDEFLYSLKRRGFIDIRGKAEEKEVRLVTPLRIDSRGNLCPIPLPCPCCGSEQLWVGQCSHDAYKLQCIDCGLNIERDSKRAACIAWNQRPIRS